MARATEAQIRTRIETAIFAFENARLFGHVNAQNLIENTEAYYATGIAGSFPRSSAADSGMAGVRAAMSAVVAPATVRSVLDPLWREYAEIQGYRVTSAIDALSRLRQDFVDNAESVNSRDFTWGSASAGGSNVGNGLIYRVTVDKDGKELEAAHTETKTLTCTADEHSGGQENAEVFEFRGEPAETDAIVVDGSGVLTSLTTLNARSSGLLQNPSFESFAGTVTVPTSITGWTAASAISNYQLDTTTYRGYPGQPTQLYSLRIDANDTISQNLNVTRARIDPNVPYVCQVAWNVEEGTGDGTITLKLGSQTVSVATSSETGWQILKLPLDANLFLQGWNQEDPVVSIQLASRTTGYVLVDDVVFAPMTAIDGTFWSIMGGATPFLRDDVFTVTDSATDAAIIQRWIARAYSAYLPSHDTTETWADPT